jgi:hypothetical protein
MHAPRPTGGATPGTLFRAQLAVGNSEFWKIDIPCKIDVHCTSPARMSEAEVGSLSAETIKFYFSVPCGTNLSSEKAFAFKGRSNRS